MSSVQLDDNKVLRKAILRAMDMAEGDLKDGHCKFNPRTKSFEPKRTARELMAALGFSWRGGHLRAVSSAYRAVFFNMSAIKHGGSYGR